MADKSTDAQHLEYITNMIRKAGHENQSRGKTQVYAKTVPSVAIEIGAGTGIVVAVHQGVAHVFINSHGSNVDGTCYTTHDSGIERCVQYVVGYADGFERAISLPRLD